MPERTIVIGAGVAGLQCAQELQRAGREVLVLERAQSVGGRCATRTFEGQPVDFGPMFLHGSDPGFLKTLGDVQGVHGLSDWPRHLQGNGLPCQPDALDPAVQRIAFAEGVKALPRQLALGIEVRLRTAVTAITAMDGGFTLATAGGPPLRCRDLVLALALEESQALLATLAPGAEVAGIQALLGLFGSLPCLTLIGGYPLSVPEPPWDLLYPRESQCLQLVAQDSAKRQAPTFRVFVAQARPQWSRARLEDPLTTWSRTILEEMSALLGPWALEPLWTHPHRWRYARTEATSALAQPVQITLPGGPRLGLAGDLFSPGGGVQAAWLSGNRMAQRLLQKDVA